MGQYKKGDWVRAAREVVTKQWNDFWSKESGFVAGKDSVFQIGEVNYAGNRIGAGSVKLGPHWSDEDLEPWRPKVGERVRVPASANSVWAGDAIIKEVKSTFYVLTMTSGRNAGFEGGFMLSEIEPITDTLPVAEQPAALTIQPGKFYKTRDGRKVGPMRASTRADWPFIANAEGESDAWYEADGTCPYIPHDDLIAEWVDPVAPTTNLAATVDAINDEYGPVVREVPVAAQQARFKVGDRVQSLLSGSILTITAVEQAPRSGKFVYSAEGDNLARGRFVDEHIRLAPAPAIVCKIDNGQPLPASRPVVHSTVEAADAEAKRLANLHTGQEFGVYALTGTPHRVARVYDHEWQRLAAAGQRVAAIKALRSVAGLDLKPAKESVDYFISFAA